MHINRRTFITSTGAAIAGASIFSGLAGKAFAETGHLRIAMTAADVPTTTGIPNNGGEGMRFLGYPAFEPLVDWDLLGATEHRANIRPGLATEWSVDDATKTVWTFKLREGVTFHDGAPLNAELVHWNFERIYNKEAPHFDQAGSALTLSRLPMVTSYRVVDDLTFEVTTDRPTGFFPSLMTQFPMVSPARYAELGDWTKFAAAPAGSGPFMITKVNPRVSVEMAPFGDYWNAERVPKVNKMTLFPMPEATTRLAALRSGQVDWIEVPPPDTIPSLKDAGFNIVTRIYPHIWPWVYNMQEGSPFADKRVRQALNYAIDRDGLVALLNGTALPAKGYVVEDDVWFGKPTQDYGYDPEKAKALLKEAGYDEANPLTIKVMISTSGSGQMMPLPMNEFLQQSLAQVGVNVQYEVVEWGTMLVAFRMPPDDPAGLGCHAMNISLSWMEPSVWWRWFHADAATPVSSNWGHWKNAEFGALIDQVRDTFDDKETDALLAKAHEVIVEDAPWLFIVHDLNPRAFSPKVENFDQAQSWYQDFTGVTVL